MKKLLFTLIFIGFVQQAYGQFYSTRYRPPGLNWQQLETPHFLIVFPGGEDSAAYHTARILEHEYSGVQDLAGGSLSRFPVVLNNYNDLSNGFVSPYNFRAEIEIPRIKGKSMNPRTGNWLETVAPHELVHALHFNHHNGVWTKFLSLFSPDAARSLHSAVPFGVHEGIATYYETEEVTNGGGRGNYPYFYNRFNSVFSGSDRWSLGQMLSLSSYSRPFDRHYLGGYRFTKWLHETYGSDITRETIDFYIRWPFLGYGFALKNTTGDWPGELYDRFEEDREEAHTQQDTSRYTPLEIPFKGRELHRPVWLSDTRLLLYASFYNARPGFYTFDLETGSLDRILETRSVRDYNYDLSRDREKLLFSNYRPDARYNRAYTMELYETRISTTETRRLTSGLRGHAPRYLGSDIIALRTDHESSAFVRLEDAPGTSHILTDSLSLPNTDFVAIASNPVNPGQLAVVANRRGLQGLWIADVSSLRSALREAPDISFGEGSVFDPAWHPSGERLLFTADYSGTMQIYEFNMGNNSIRRLTNSAFNAMEASFSPDGYSIAFIIQDGNEQLPVVLNRDALLTEAIPSTLWQPAAARGSLMIRLEHGSELRAQSGEWVQSDYTPGLRWLKPRMILPVVDEVSSTDTYQIGFGLQGSDLLQRNYYNLELTSVQRLPWYDLTYRHTGFFPGLEVNVFNRPSFPVLQAEDPTGAVQRFSLLRQDLGISAGIPVRFTLENNVRHSSLGFTPSLKIRGTRFFELDHRGDAASEFSTFYTGNFFAFFNYKLQQNIRDLQPNAGLALYTELEHFINRDSNLIRTTQNEIQIDFIKPTAWRSGLFLFTSPLRRFNQSLRIGIEGITQTAGLFNNQSIVSDGFSEAVFPGARNLLSVTTRYTVPITYPDDGGFLIPFYLGNLYAVGFANTVKKVNPGGAEEFFSTAGTRTTYGIGLRSRFRISNFTIDLGAAVAFEPTRDRAHFFIGNF